MVTGGPVKASERVLNLQGKHLSFPVGLEHAGTAVVVSEPQAGLFEERTPMEEPGVSELRYTHSGIRLSHKKEEHLPSVTAWVSETALC